MVDVIKRSVHILEVKIFSLSLKIGVGLNHVEHDMLRSLFLVSLILLQFPFAFAQSAKEKTAISERDILEAFFRTLFEDSEGGYVLYGSKPICGEGVLPKEENLFMLGDSLHKKNVILREGFKVWRNLACKCGKYFTHFYEKPSYGWQHLLLINREAFIKVVKENLALFQYVLGPDVSPEKLFLELIDPQESFSSVFKENKVLIGIALGFGTQNALYVSRGENIEGSLSGIEKIPFKPSDLRSRKFRKKGVYNPHIEETTPGFSHLSLKDELDDLNQAIFISRDLVKDSSPSIPCFGCLKSRETTQLLEGYSKAQKKIQGLLADDRFLEKLLTRFVGTEKKAAQMLQNLSSNCQDLGNESHFSSWIAQYIKQGLPEHDEEWMSSFIQGMQAYEKQNTLPSAEQWIPLLDRHREAEKNLEGKRNLIACEKLFSGLVERTDLTCLIPEKLYYKVIKDGEGETINTSFCTVQLDYVVKNHSGTILRAAQASEMGSIDLTDLIIGLSAAMQGMSIGEEREIYIHPAFAYGESFNFSSNTPLLVEVKLVSIIAQETGKEEPPLVPLKLSVVDPSEKELSKKYQELRSQVAFQLGVRTWAHFEKGQEYGYSLDSIINYLLQENTEPKHFLCSETNEILSRLHWKLYQ